MERYKSYEKIFVLFAVILINLFLNADSYAIKVTRLIKKVEPATVLIITYDSTGQMFSQGSGFFA